MKKNNKAFTLVELLTTIVILGIIAVIATPIITDVISDSKKNAFKNSAYGIVDAANQYYLNSKLNNEVFDEITFTVSNNKLMSGNKELLFQGKSPIGSSYVKINKNGEVAINITDGTYYATKDYEESGVLIAGEESDAVTREELARKISELETLLNSNTELIQNLQNELNEKSEEINAKIEENNTNVNNNTTLITELTNINNTNNIFLKTYPVGSIYISTNSTNPSSIYGGTWERYGNGKTLVGVNESEEEFATASKTGGNKIHTHKYGLQYGAYHRSLSIEKNPYAGLFNYSSDNTYSITGGGTHITSYDAPINAAIVESDSSSSIYHYTMIANTSYTSNLQPYITVYMWKRVS